MAIKRSGGALALGENRIGVPLTDMPGQRWMAALREAMTELNTDDDRWQALTESMRSDKADDVPHLVLDGAGANPVDYLMSYFQSIDESIAAANERTWQIIGDPEEVSPSDRDSRHYRHRVAKGADERSVSVYISNSLMASGPEGRDPVAASAILTAGRTLLLDSLDKHAEPPRSIKLSTGGVWEDRPDD